MPEWFQKNCLQFFLKITVPRQEKESETPPEQAGGAGMKPMETQWKNLTT